MAWGIVDRINSRLFLSVLLYRAQSEATAHFFCLYYYCAPSFFFLEKMYFFLGLGPSFFPLPGFSVYYFCLPSLGAHPRKKSKKKFTWKKRRREKKTSQKKGTKKTMRNMSEERTRGAKNQYLRQGDESLPRPVGSKYRTNSPWYYSICPFCLFSAHSMHLFCFSTLWLMKINKSRTHREKKVFSCQTVAVVVKFFSRLYTNAILPPTPPPPRSDFCSKLIAAPLASSTVTIPRQKREQVRAKIFSRESRLTNIIKSKKIR